MLFWSVVLMAARLVFRLIYLIIPLLIALLIVFVFEHSQFGRDAN